MRENMGLYRGKRVDNGEWVYGYYSAFHNKPIIPQISHQFFVPKDDAYFYGSMIGGFWYEVDPETIGQYTGLNDKNGKKIFEGDILDCQDRIVDVKWNTACGTWDCDFIKYIRKLCSNGISPVEWKYRANIIGNIHDNPSLMKGGQDG